MTKTMTYKRFDLILTTFLGFLICAGIIILHMSAAGFTAAGIACTIGCALNGWALGFGWNK